ncbi:MAG: hypothetical protein ACRDH7_13080 [Actinomycetota bacterium]
MSTEVVQTLVNALLLLVVAFVGGSLGLRRFEAIERSIADLRTEVKTDIAGFRAEVKADIAGFRAEVKADLAELRGEQAQMRSDLTHVALAVGARPAQGSGTS